LPCTNLGKTLNELCFVQIRVLSRGAVIGKILPKLLALPWPIN
jgi:hypothetical protein